MTPAPSTIIKMRQHYYIEYRRQKRTQQQLEGEMENNIDEWYNTTYLKFNSLRGLTLYGRSQYRCSANCTPRPQSLYQQNIPKYFAQMRKVKRIRIKKSQSKEVKTKIHNAKWGKELDLRLHIPNWMRKSKRRRTLREMWEMNSRFSQSAWTAIPTFTAFVIPPALAIVWEGKQRLCT